MIDISRDTIIRASEGDIQVFEDIYRTYSGFVYNVALRVMRNQEAAEEITQDVFMIIYRKLTQFNFQSSFSTWLYRIAVNQSINYGKRLTRERNKMVAYNENLETKHSTSAVSEAIEKEQSDITINTLLDALNPEQRACIVLRNIEGLSYEEIAQTLKININTVRSRLKRAREKLLALRKEVVPHEM